ncbi:hypothetical protein BOX15_Mlig021393g3 [Macrostomum lignano]|uniref:Uncharacterized protein n=2 Tax=Macrostomum lignano TaxID=282301 RepID=A0A267GRW1_9PLAT|nr:hypothetical protein BOX15_Mlig021393g3 [Macrostomum lignano]
MDSASSKPAASGNVDIGNSGDKRGQGRRLALLSVTDKSGLVDFARQLVQQHGYDLVSSGGTASVLSQAGIPVQEVSDLTGFPEMLGGRVKTLHPAIHAGILSRSDNPSDAADMSARGLRQIDMVVCNLYAFQSVVASDTVDPSQAIESVDIGGVALLRAAAKNHCRVVVVCQPGDYDAILTELAAPDGGHEVTAATRKRLAVQAFCHTSDYDAAIAGYFGRAYFGQYQDINFIPLRYGMNPHQVPASISHPLGLSLPIVTKCGSPGYVNLLDALNAWQLVRELREALGAPAAASFKHVSPAGAAIGTLPIDPETAAACMVADLAAELTPLAVAYARARSADRMSSFGDFIALSDPCDLATARVISREVSDGIIAPGYEPDAFELLQKKKGGKYCILAMDPDFQPPLEESRTLFGLRLRQRRNDARIDPAEMFAKFSADARRDLTVATIAVKYTQSNSVCLAKDGQVVGIGAGQQSRVHCTRLAASKADNWWLRRHPRAAELRFKRGVKRPEIANYIDRFVADELLPGDAELLEDAATRPLGPEERRDWLEKLTGVCLSSDAFFPFRDSIDRAAKSGVKFVSAPGGSANDAEVLEACGQHGIEIAFSNTRLFHH